jgi:DNA topoisomerase-3
MPTVVLSVAEKPSVAKELAAIISKEPPERIRRAGFSPYNPIFQIEKCSFRDQQVCMTMTSVSGHMMELEFDTAYKGWFSCSPVDLFTAPVNKGVKKENQLIQKTLATEAKKASILLLWLDCDLEGENIAYEVIKVCKEANPRLDIYRARFSALIERDIQRTLRFPDRPNPNMNDAVDTRQEIDLRIGAAFTRWQTMRLQKKFQDIGSNTGVISYGPCQFPTLGFVVERDLAIKSFAAEKFWKINFDAEFTDPDSSGSNNAKKVTLNFNWERSCVYDEFTAIILYESCLDHTNPLGKLAKVISCEEKPTSKWRPVPLNTIEFQILASRYLRMGSDKAMNIAESLYQRGILSYPRTETNFFKEGFELDPLLQDHVGHSAWGTYVNGLLTNNKFQWPRNGNKDDQAHPPIHPTKCLELKDLDSDDERKIYELVCRHFFACCSTDAKGSSTTIKVKMPAKTDEEVEDPTNGNASYGEMFTASGLMIYERNWLDVYSKYDSWHAHKIPTLTVGDTFQPKNFLLVDGKTSPPSPISEAELIAIMDNNGIGTDATIATHISTIQQREYARKDPSNRFTPTALGLALIEGYNSMGYQLNKPYLRAQIEADCQRVARGEMRKEDAISKCLNTMKACFLVCSREVIKLDNAVAKYFPLLGTGNNASYHVLKGEFSLCGSCKNKMDLRIESGNNNNNNNNNNNAGEDGGNKEKKRYLFCLTCQKSHVLPKNGDVCQSTNNFCCPICSYEVIIMKNPETNKDHTICPYCFNNPPPPPFGTDGLQEFRLFSGLLSLWHFFVVFLVGVFSVLTQNVSSVVDLLVLNLTYPIVLNLQNALGL